MLDEKFKEIDDIIAQAVAKKEFESGSYGINIGGVFIGNDGSIVHRIQMPVVIREVARQRAKELEQKISFYRNELAKAEDTLEAVKSIAL